MLKISYYEEVMAAKHSRLIGCHEWRLDIEHYLATLKKKPGALAGSLALQQAETKIKQIYAQYYTTQPRDFIELLQFLQNNDISLTKLENSIARLCEMHPRHVTTDKIKVLCAKQKENAPEVTELSENGYEIEDLAQRHLQQYKELFQMGDLSPKEVIA